MIQFLEPEFAKATAQLLETTILESPHYSPLAKTEEIAGLTAVKLLAMPKQDVHIAVEENTVLGVLVSSGKEAGLLWLSWIVVSPAARGRGVAGALITSFHASAAARGVHKTWCDSRVGNASSARMLEKAGYKVVATLEKHWYGLDYLIWERLVVS
jgi:ribosomal protein S18 acetylase RimI-like enzyme